MTYRWFRPTILFGLWILLTLVLWARGEVFFVAMLFGAVAVVILDAFLALVSGAWGVGQGARWLFRQFRVKP